MAPGTVRHEFNVRRGQLRSLRTHIAATDVVPTSDGAYRANRHLVVLHLASSSLLFTAMFDVQLGTCAGNLACTSCSRGHRLAGLCSDPQNASVQRMQEGARCQISASETRAVFRSTQWIGGECLISYDKEHMVPKTRLNHDLSTSRAQVVPGSRYHFLTQVLQLPHSVDVLCNHHGKPESRSWDHFEIQGSILRGCMGQ